MKVNSVYQISDEPRIYFGLGSKHWGQLSAPAGTKAYLLTHPMWYFNFGSAYLFWKFKRDLQKRNIELRICHSSRSEMIFAKLLGLKGHFVNHNLHVCEHIFKPIPGTQKIYDAVYVAAAKKYKRIHLAKSIKKMFIITYFWPDVRNDKGEWDLHAFEPSVSHAEFNRDRINHEQINQIMNQSYCGLALSRKEGAMFASMEYQLAGLPVVTTPSKGGRDVLLDPQHTTWVHPGEKEVAEAVNAWVKNPPDPQEIRNRSLANQRLHRERFYEVVRDICEQHQKPVEPFESFHSRIWGSATSLEAIRVI